MVRILPTLPSASPVLKRDYMYGGDYELEKAFGGAGRINRRGHQLPGLSSLLKNPSQVNACG